MIKNKIKILKIKLLCKLYKVKYYEILKNNYINIYQDVDLSWRNLKDIKLKINKVEGNFFINCNELKNYNLPKYIYGGLKIYGNKKQITEQEIRNKCKVYGFIL